MEGRLPNVQHCPASHMMGLDLLTHRRRPRRFDRPADASHGREVAVPTAALQPLDSSVESIATAGDSALARTGSAGLVALFVGGWPSASPLLSKKERCPAFTTGEVDAVDVSSSNCSSSRRAVQHTWGESDTTRIREHSAESNIHCGISNPRRRSCSGIWQSKTSARSLRCLLPIRTSRPKSGCQGYWTLRSSVRWVLCCGVVSPRAEPPRVGEPPDRA